MGNALNQTLKGLAATVALLALVAGFPLALAVFVGWPLPTALPSFSEITEAARSGVDDMVIVKTLAVLGWIAWGQLALAVAVEAVALSRGRTARTMPVLPGLQVTATHLLAGVALLLGAFSSPRDHPVPLRALAAVSQAPPVTLTTVADPPPPQQHLPPRPPNAGRPEPAPTYTVQRNDSWWEIAESQLGDGLRWQELRRLNVGRTMPDGRAINPDTETIYEGWVLELPADRAADDDRGATFAEATEIVVEPGDNLWDIAEEHLEQLHQRPVVDDEVRPYWHDVVAANRQRLADSDDPNLIFTGQVIHLPGVNTDPPAAPPPLSTTEPIPPTEPTESTEPPRPDDHAAPAAPDGVGHTGSLDGDAATVTSTPPVTEVAEPDHGSEGRSTDDDTDEVATGTGLLGTAGALLAVGISASVWRRRRRRELTLPRGTAPPVPPPDLDDLRAEIVRRGDLDHADALHRALAEAAAELARRRSGARVRLIQAGEDRIELLVSEPVLPAPPGWRPEASGTAWVHDRATVAGKLSGPPTHPTLISLGRHDTSAQLYIDLESEGLLCILGESPAYDLARSIVLELATSPPAEGVTVVVVGDLDVGASPDRIRHVRTWDEIADDALAWAEQTRSLLTANRWPSPHAGRALGHRPDDLAPLVIVLSDEPDDARFDALCTTIGEAVVPVVVVLVGAKLDGATIVEVGADELRIPTLGLTCAPQRISTETAEDIDRLLTSADGPPGQLSLISDPPEDPDDEPAPGQDGVYVDPPFDILVRVLGEIEVVGGRQPLSPKQTAVVTFIALHSPTSAERVEDAVWSAPTASRRKRLANTISDARPSLGADHLPAAYDGRYRVGPRVKTDLELFELRLTYARTQDPEAAIETLRAALELVTDRVFTYRNADRASYAWVDTENWIATTELKVTDTAEDLAERYLEADDVDGAIWAATRGLLASPTHTRLTHLLMRAYFAAGDAKAAERVYESYVSALEQLHLDDVDPELAETYEQIRRGTAAVG